MSDSLLSGVTVIDLSRVLAGPFATMTLANLGARVIKIEIPGDGDDSRAFGPFVNGKSLYFSSVNCNKESIALNLKMDSDRAVFEKLLESADVLIENYRPGTMEKLGYGWDVLHQKFPRLIYGAASGFGDNGPYSKRPAYDMVVQGMGGLLSLTGHPNSPAARVGISIGDITAGLYLAIGVNAALYRRTMTQAGSKIDIAMLDCQVAILENAIQSYSKTGVIPGPLGTRHPSIAPFELFTAKDGQLVIAAGNDHLFEALANALERPDFLTDQRFKTNEDRYLHIEVLKKEMEQTLKTNTVAIWLTVLEQAGVPCGPLNDIPHVISDPQVIARNMIIEVDDPIIGSVKTAGNPIKVIGQPDDINFRPSPELDADREAIFKEFIDTK